MASYSRKDVMDAVLGVIELDTSPCSPRKCVVVFVEPRKGAVPKLRVKATRIPTSGRNIELRVTIGRLAYAEREKCKQWARADVAPQRIWVRR